LLPQQFSNRDQASEQIELVLERLERCRHGAALGLALGQGGEGVEVGAGHGPDLAAAEAVALQLPRAVQLEGHRHRRLLLVHLEGSGFAQGTAQQRQPLGADAQGIGLVAQPEIEAAAGGEALSNSRAVQPEGESPLPVGLQAQGRQARSLFAAPALQQQHRLVGEVGAFLRFQAAQSGPGGAGTGVETVLGEQQVEIGAVASVHRQPPGHMALGGELGHRIAVDQHLHHRLLLGIQVLGVTLGQLHTGEQAIVERGGHQPLLLLLHLGQQTGGVALKDALHAPLRRAAASTFPGHFHQHPIAVPGVVELVFADVHILTTVFPQGKAEPLAGAAQACRNQLRVGVAQQPSLTFLHQLQPLEGIETDAQLLLVRPGGETQSFFELGLGEGLLGGELVEQVGDRELHRGWQLVGGGHRECPLEGR
jgi:hypothetical protein